MVRDVAELLAEVVYATALERCRSLEASSPESYCVADGSGSWDITFDWADDESLCTTDNPDDDFEVTVIQGLKCQSVVLNLPSGAWVSVDHDNIEYSDDQGQLDVLAHFVRLRCVARADAITAIQADDSYDDTDLTFFKVSLNE